MIKLTRLKEMIAEKGQTYKKCAAGFSWNDRKRKN